MASTRGLVVAPRFVWDGHTLSFPGLVGLAPSDLRRYALYWDRLDFPDNKLIGIASSPEVDYLATAGVLGRTRVVVRQSGNVGALYVLAQFEAFQQLSAKDPGLWTIGQSAADFYAPREVSAPSRGIEVELYEALPTPPDNVALSDVLEFKHRRVSELGALRANLDDLYLEINKAGDIPRAKTAALDRLGQTVADLNRVANETWPSRVMSSVKVELNIPDIAAKASAGLVIALSVGVPGSVGAAIGAAAASIKISINEMMAPRLPNGLRDFAYVYRQLNELK